ncbi:MAG TPA: outer membrane beta-barrel protein [Terracidiphilus sp.]|nr:outer membrane beta-barrel protein [Terracidiphilus sp.]
MKRSIVAWLSILLAAATLPAHAQVVPSAVARQFSITAGALASGFQTDYQGGYVAQSSSYPLYGAGAYVDVKFTRWVQVEAEGRWLRFNQLKNINQSNYLIGPRIPIQSMRFWRATPYAKVLIGYGKMNFEYNEGTGSFTDIAYGGGVDIKLTKRISIRAIDVEYQQWPRWLNSSLYPYGASVGIGYKVY